MSVRVVPPSSVLATTHTRNCHSDGIRVTDQDKDRQAEQKITVLCRMSAVPKTLCPHKNTKSLSADVTAVQMPTPDLLNNTISHDISVLRTQSDVEL